MKTWRWIMAFGAAGALVAACTSKGSDEDDGAGGSGTTTAASVTSSGTGPGPSSSGAGGGNQGCYDETNAAHFGDGYEPMPAGQDACTTVLVDEFITACGSAGTQQTCDAYVAVGAANETCFNCAFAGYDTGSEYADYYPFLVGPEGAEWIYVNDTPCHYAVAGMLECVVPVSNYGLCYSSACGACPLDATLDECLAFAETQTIQFCEDIVIPAGCDAVEPAPACEGTDFDSTFTAVLNVMCVAP
jgi:hypothetical protein